MRVYGHLFWFFLAAAGALLLYLGKTGDRSGPAPGIEGDSLAAAPAPAGAGPRDNAAKTMTPRRNAARGSEKPRVVSTDGGTPIPGARVCLCEPAEPEWVQVTGTCVLRASAQVVWQDTTGSDGTFTWPNDLVGGTYLLTVEAEGYAPRSQSLTLPQPVPGSVFELSTGGTLLVTGLETANVPVIVTAPRGLVLLKKTAAQGEARFSNLAPGSYAVMIGDPHMGGIARSRAPGQRRAPPYEHEVREDATVRVDLSRKRAALAEVRGHMIGASQGEITLRSRRDTPFLLRTHPLGNDGAFSFTFVPPGEYELVLMPALGRAHVVEITVEKGESRDIESAFPLAAISGVVLGANDAKPLPRADVRLQVEDGSGELAAITDERGTFRFENLIPGAYRLRVTGTTEGQSPLTRQVIARAGAPQAAIRIPYPQRR